MAAASKIIRRYAPSLDPDISSYLSSYVSDSTSAQTLTQDEGAELHSFVTDLLAYEDLSKEQLEQAESEFRQLMQEMTESDASRRSQWSSEPTRLEQVISMRAQPSMSVTANASLTGGVDVTSINASRESKVDIAKLQKAEAKLKAKREKRAARVDYESSKLLNASSQQKDYEQLFLEVNSLQALAQSKGKSKDVHLANIDVNFGSNKILTNASLTLAQGRRYGIIGRNGVGKSTLLRQIALREVPIPSHISILYVEQEVKGDETTALDSVLTADVWRERLLKEEAELQELPEADTSSSKRLAEVHELLADIDAESGPARAAELLAGLGFSEADQKKPTKSFSGGWRMRLSLARALFVRPDLLMLDEPSNNLDLNALAWLEDYLQTSWPNTLLVVSHDRSFLDQVATDIIHQHSERLDYYKGNFTQFYATKEDRKAQQKREYEAQQQLRQHLQAFIDRWRYNANRASQAQMKIKQLEKLPELEPPEDETKVTFKFAEAEKLSPPLLQLSDVTFGYGDGRKILDNVSIDVSYDSRLGLIGPNGAGKSTLLKLLIGDNQPQAGHVTKNGRLRVGYFAQHHIDQLELDVPPVTFLQRKFPGQTEQEYRSHLGSFGITGTTGLQVMATLSGGQKSRVAFAALSMQRPHILCLDEPTNHLDIEGLDALMDALRVWQGGVILISHDERFINNVCKELWICADGKVKKHKGDVSSYKKLIVENTKNRPQ